MGKLLHSNTSTALWYEIIYEAENSCEITLKQELEWYLIGLLIRFTANPQIVKQIMAIDFLQGLKLAKHQREVVLQDVGDKCLIFSGLFPANSEKRLVKPSYFVNLGQSAYLNISKNTNDIYALLSDEFVALMDILQTIRCYSKDYPDLLPIKAYELWKETGSRRAFSVLQQYTSAIPLLIREK